MLNLDTHILVGLSFGQLTARENSLLVRDPRWGISGIVLWEIENLFALGRLRYGIDHPLTAAVLEAVEVWPIDREVCLQSRRLDFRGDPADAIIAATSLAHRVPLVTRDTRIRRSKIVRCV